MKIGGKTRGNVDDKGSGQSPSLSSEGSTVMENVASRSFYFLPTILESFGSDPRVVEVGAELTGGWATLCIKLGYSSREPRKVARPCINIGYVSAMY